MILLQTAKEQSPGVAIHPHDWLVNNGRNPWDRWEVYVQDKNNSVWKATLHIANASSGEKILYDVQPIKMVEQHGKSRTSTTNGNNTTPAPKVNTQNSPGSQNSLKGLDADAIPESIRRYGQIRP